MTASAFQELLQKSASVPAFFKETTEPGATVTGRITEVTVRQRTKYMSNPPELEVFPSGDPKMEVVLTLDTDLVDSAVEDDDGLRRLYINWWGDKRRALEAAVRAADDNDLRIGGTFTARYDGLGPKQPGISAPKVYTFWYEKPSALGMTPAPPVQRAAPVAAAVPPPPALPPAPAGNDMAALAEEIRSHMAAGWTDEQLVAGPFPNVTRATLAAIRNMPPA